MAKVLNLLFVFLILICPDASAQHFGFSLGYASINAPFGDVFYERNKFSYHIGITSQNSDAKGKEVGSQKENYGRTVVGNGSYIFSVDLGIGYNVLEKIKVNIELSFGTRKYYTNYSDLRFTDDGYHMITKSESIVGLGSSINLIVERLQFFFSYNYLREAGLGFRITW